MNSLSFPEDFLWGVATSGLEPPTTEVAGFLLHRPLPLLVLHGFHRRNFRQFLPYKLLLNRVYNTQSFL